jgi:GNAT superfamily N-acetyltransferase
MALPGADHEDAAVMAATTRSGEVVCTAAVTPETPPEPLDGALGGGRRWRLRSMATRPDVRGDGIGAAVLNAVLDHVAARGGGVLWCSARTPAFSFYERAGFLAYGEPWLDEKIGPHILMWRKVATRASGDHVVQDVES